MLMNQRFFRRDGMWVTQRRQDASSRLISLCEHADIRNDKYILESYLHGRMRGIPHLLTMHGETLLGQPSIFAYYVHVTWTYA